MLSFHGVALGYAPMAPPMAQQARAHVSMETAADMEALSKKLNPALGFWDPLALVDMGSDEGFFDKSAAIGFLRQAELKHGRIAMAAFVGFLVQTAGIHFPWALQGAAFGGETITFGDIAAAGGPGDQWDALPTPAKLQIFAAIGFLEGWGENSNALKADGMAHYMRGGKPGYFPSFKGDSRGPAIHPVPLDLWDPFGFTKKLSAERKETALLAEINNGRLAMVGIMGMLSVSKGLIVPGLDSVPIQKYAGEYMAPLSAVNADLPFVSDMLNYKFALFPSWG